MKCFNCETETPGPGFFYCSYACEHKDEHIDGEYKLKEKALRALCLTRDYVGEGLLPAIEGWEWYDAGMALSESIPDSVWAEQFKLRIKE